MFGGASRVLLCFACRALEGMAFLEGAYSVFGWV